MTIAIRHLVQLFSCHSSQRCKQAYRPNQQDLANNTSANSPDVASKERRRKKNRQAQAAFRERQKKVIDDLRHDLARQVQYNQVLKRKMYNMVASMELMKGEFEEALALEPQLASGDLLRTGVLEIRDSPAPSSEISYGSR